MHFVCFQNNLFASQIAEVDERGLDESLKNSFTTITRIRWAIVCVLCIWNKKKISETDYSI